MTVIQRAHEGINSLYWKQTEGQGKIRGMASAQHLGEFEMTRSSVFCKLWG